MSSFLPLPMVSPTRTRTGNMCLRRLTSWVLSPIIT
nr:MAG TPA: hypothetical protein [Caudoviricetes sp.]